MAILRPYKVQSYRRLCDVCGRPRQIEDIRFVDNVAICTIHPQYRTAQQLNRIAARARPTRLLPVPHPKPFSPVDTWTAEESQIFNFVCATAPYDTVDVSTNAGAIVGGRSFAAAGWALVYLTGILAENKRPAAWLTSARKVAVSMAAYLMANQIGPAAGNASVGGLTPDPDQSNRQFASDAALACAGWLRLYNLIGGQPYLSAALLAAGFLVGLQVTNLNLNDPATFLGACCAAWSQSDQEYFATYYPKDLAAVWAWSLLQGVVGDIAIGPAAGFSAGASRLISVAIAQARAFWVDGVAGVNGFSAATPYDRYNGSIGAWESIFVTTNNWAAGIFALAEVDGVSSQVLELWTHLRGLTGSADFDPTLAPSTEFEGAASNTIFYDWASAGLLAKVTASRDRAAVKTIKDTLAVPRQRYVEATPRSGETLYLGPLGLSGFGFDPTTGFTFSVERIRSVTRASQVGMLYRQLPQGFIGRGHE